MTDKIQYLDFERVDIRAGTVIEAKPFPEARKPAYQLKIDFGPELGRSALQHRSRIITHAMT